MAVYELNLSVKVDPVDQDVIEVLKDKIVSIGNNKLWLDDHRVNEYPEDGCSVYVASVRFNDTADRTAVRTWLHDKIQTVEAKLLTGSFIKYHKCYHDEGKPCSEIVTLWEKV